jgi:predicted GTPase
LGWTPASRNTRIAVCDVAILGRINQAMTETRREVRSHVKQHPEFAEIGERLLEEWEKGAAHSLPAG